MCHSARLVRYVALGLLGTLGSATALAAEGDAVAVTIYSSARPGAIPADLYRPVPGSGVPNAMAVPGYAMVRQDRTISLPAGRSTVRFTDVAALIDPTTVTFSSLTDPRTRVLEQNFQFDLVSTDKLLLRYIDRPITVEHTLGNEASTVSGTLLSAADGLVLRADDGTIHALRNYSAVRFPELPGGLNTRPTLVWDLQAARAGEHRTRVTYQTSGITWWADYNLIFSDGKNANSGTLDVAAWVSIINQSGASYPEARLKLIAGDVNRVPEATPMMRRRADEIMVTATVAEGFEEKDFFEFHLYTLGRPTTLPNNSTKQIELFEEARKVPARRTLVYYGLPVSWPYRGDPVTDRDLGIPSNRKVDVYLEFRNAKAHGLGIPLPAGRIRVSRLDPADGSLEFIGEDAIDHTPKDEDVRVKLGSAFDVVGERRQVDFQIDTRAHRIEEEIEIRLRNHKEEPVEVIVKENLYRWSNWTVVSQSHEFTKEDARTIHFPVKVPRDGETVVRYRVRYTW